jgi:hypothetical protein
LRFRNGHLDLVYRLLQQGGHRVYMYVSFRVPKKDRCKNYNIGLQLGQDLSLQKGIQVLSTTMKSYFYRILSYFQAIHYTSTALSSIIEALPNFECLDPLSISLVSTTPVAVDLSTKAISSMLVIVTEPCAPRMRCRALRLARSEET